MSVEPLRCSMVPPKPRKCSPRPKRLLEKVEFQSTTTPGDSRETAMVSGTWRPAGCGAVAEEELPVDVIGVTIGGNGAHPLAVAAGGVARHPGLDHGDLAEVALADPAFCVFEFAGAFVLQAELDDLFGGAGGLEAGAGLLDVPGHGFFAVEVLAGGQGGEEILRVQVEGRGVDDRVDVLAVEQA